MRYFRMLLMLITLALAAQAQDGTQILETAMKEMPQCALQCMILAVSKSNCGLSDFYCRSSDKELNDEMHNCIRKTCTFKEALVAKNFSETAYGHPIRDHSNISLNTTVTAGSLAILAVILRIISRLPLYGGIWGLDDWAILVAMIPVLPLTAIVIPMAFNGLGKDMWTVPFDKITRILHLYYFGEIFYLSSIPLTKISILLFYLRIFPSRAFQRWVYVTIMLCVLYLISFVMSSMLQCIPIAYAWEKWHGEQQGGCINLNLEGWISAAFNISLDLIVICLPLRQLSRLAMSRRKKIGIMFMFLGGILVTIVSVLRLKSMIQFANSENITWDYTAIGYWSTLEVHVGIIIACFPALRSLQYRLFPSIRLPSKYGKSLSRAYMFNSQGRGISASAVKSGEKSNVDKTATAQPDILRGHEQTKSERNFSRLRKHVSSKGEDKLETMTRDMSQSGDSSQSDRGSSHAKDVVLLPLRGMQSSTTLPNPTYQRQASITSEWGGVVSPPNAITVRKDYIVTVEENHDPTSSSPP